MELSGHILLLILVHVLRTAYAVREVHVDVLCVLGLAVTVMKWMCKKQVCKRSDHPVILALHATCVKQKSFWSYESHLIYSTCVQKQNVGSPVLQI